MSQQAPKRAVESESIMECIDLSVTFDLNRGQSRVLDHVNVALKRGEILGVVGESGSGKSMFASSLLDAVVEPGRTTGTIEYHPEPDQTVHVLDQTPEELRRMRWEDIAMVFQGAMDSWNPTMRIGKHFEETLSAHDQPKGEGMKRAHQLLGDVYLDSDRVLNSYPHELSGGMKQRALVALALVLEPDVLVMDEPTAALDLLMQRSIIALLANLKEEYNLTMVFITHDLELAAGLADRLAVMYAFEFVEIGPAHEIVHDGRHPYTRALINSTPNLDTPVEEMEPIAGESPDPVNVPQGCSYHPRCPLADERCEESDPPMYSTTDESTTDRIATDRITTDESATDRNTTATDETAHDAACHYWERVPEAIPLHLGTGSDDE